MKIDYEELILRIVKNLIIVIIITLIVYLVPDDIEKIKKAIKRVASKNQRLITKFKEEHPDCTKYHSRYSDQYNKIIVESMGGSGNNDTEKEEKIIRNISKIVSVDK